jgi:hypothetical protein
LFHFGICESYSLYSSKFENKSKSFFFNQIHLHTHPFIRVPFFRIRSFASEYEEYYLIEDADYLNVSQLFVWLSLSCLMFFEIFVDVVIGVTKDMPAWPGRHLLEGGENRRYFGLKTITRGVVEFECRNQREYDVWTQGVSRLISIAAERNNKNRTC